MHTLLVPYSFLTAGLPPQEETFGFELLRNISWAAASMWLASKEGVLTASYAAVALLQSAATLAANTALLELNICADPAVARLLRGFDTTPRCLRGARDAFAARFAALRRTSALCRASRDREQWSSRPFVHSRLTHALAVMRGAPLLDESAALTIVGHILICQARGAICVVRRFA